MSNHYNASANNQRCGNIPYENVLAETSPEIKPKLPTALRSVSLINRILYLDNNPALNYILPLTNEWTAKELASEIMRACVEYDKTVTWQGAFFLAQKLIADSLRRRYEH